MEKTRDNKVETSGVCCPDREVRHTVFLFPDVPKDERFACNLSTKIFEHQVKTII